MKGLSVECASELQGKLFSSEADVRHQIPPLCRLKTRQAIHKPIISPLA